MHAIPTKRLVGVLLLGGLILGAGCGGGSASDTPGGGGNASGGNASGGRASSGGAGAATGTGGSAADGGAPGGGGSTGGTLGGDGGAGLGGAGAVTSGGASGEGGYGSGTGFGVRFVGFLGEGPTDDLPAGPEFPIDFPDCPNEPSATMPNLPRFNACYARGVVALMNSALAELVADPITFHFESLEYVVDPELAVFQSAGEGASYDLQNLLGNEYRRPNTVTFTMPTSGVGATGAAFEDQRMNDDAGVAAVAVAAGGPEVFLHEFGHAMGFPHTGTAADVPTVTYEWCGGVTIEPPVCSCEGENFMMVGTGSIIAADGCEACAPSERSTFQTPFFGPKLAAIAECWLSRRLLEPDVVFLDGDCFAIVENAVSACKQVEEGLVTCQCPSGEVFAVNDCTDASQSERDQEASDVCDRISCTPPPERPGVVCESLAGWANIECTCDDGMDKFYLGSDCSSLTLASIEQFCPPI